MPLLTTALKKCCKVSSIQRKPHWPDDNVRGTFSHKSLAYLLSLSLQRLQVVGHSFQFLFKLSTFAVILEGRQERGGWKIQSSKRNRRKEGEKIEKNENNYRAKEQPQKQLIYHRLKATLCDAEHQFKCTLRQWPDTNLSTALGLHRNIYRAFTCETVQLLLAAQEISFKDKNQWINKKRDQRKPPKQDAKRVKSIARTCYYWVS